MKDMLTAADIHYDFVDVAGQLRVNTRSLTRRAVIPR